MFRFNVLGILEACVLVCTQKAQRVVTVGAIALSLIAVPVTTWALPPEIEYDRYMLAVKNNLEDKDFARAADYLERVKALGIELSSEFYYFQAQVDQQENELSAALENYTKYIELTSKEGEHYDSVLQEITKVEEAISAQAAAEQAAPVDERSVEEIKAATAEEKDAEGLLYDKKLRELYLSDDTADAMLLHINSLLKSHAFVDSKVRNLDKGQQIHFTLSQANRSELLLTRRDTFGGERQATISVEKLPIYGVDPFVEYRCSEAANRCWLKSPVDGSEWIIIDNDAGAIADLSMAVTRLLKAMQR